MPKEASDPNVATGIPVAIGEDVNVTQALNVNDAGFLIRLIPTSGQNLSALRWAHISPTASRPQPPKKTSSRTTFKNKCPGVQISRTILLNQPQQPFAPPSFTYPTIQHQGFPPMQFASFQGPPQGQWPQQGQWSQSAHWPQSSAWQQPPSYPMTTALGQPFVSPPINVTAIANATNPNKTKECRKHTCPCPQLQFGGQAPLIIPSYMTPPSGNPYGRFSNEAPQRTSTPLENSANTMAVAVGAENKQDGGRVSGRRGATRGGPGLGGVDWESDRRGNDRHVGKHKRHKRKTSRGKQSESSSSSTSSDGRRGKRKGSKDKKKKVEEMEAPRPPIKNISMENLKAKKSEPDKLANLQAPMSPEWPIAQPRTGEKGERMMKSDKDENIMPPVNSEVDKYPSETTKAEEIEEKKGISPIFCLAVIIVVALCLAFAMLCVFVPEVIDWIFNLRSDGAPTGLHYFSPVRKRLVTLVDLLKKLIAERQMEMKALSPPEDPATQPSTIDINIEKFVDTIWRV